ncbi:MAG: lytic transglycosylase domain-containing protein [Thiobacillus sp.]|nr:lytic transglycosylase domain-containing protein [Thiobacillus sp.]
MWFLALLLAVVSPTAVPGGIYSYNAPDGSVYLSNVPADPRYASLIPDDAVTAASPTVPTPAAPLAGTDQQVLIEQAARVSRVDADLLRAVVAVESNHDARAVSSKGATGLMQLMPETASRYGITDLYDPAQNLDAGARHLRYLLERFNCDLSLALAAYNAGEGAVKRHGNSIPPYRETVAYVPKVLRLYERLRNGATPASNGAAPASDYSLCPMADQKYAANL